MKNQKQIDKALDLLDKARSILEEVCEARETYADERSETWQDGEAGDNFQVLSAAIEEAKDTVGQTHSELECVEYCANRTDLETQPERAQRKPKK
jgi:hypothetical protein